MGIQDGLFIAESYGRSLESIAFAQVSAPALGICAVDEEVLDEVIVTTPYCIVERCS